MKIYIIGHKGINTLDIGIKLQAQDDSLTVAPHFTTDPEEVTEYKYFLDKETVNISYKNNAIIAIMTNDNESHGIIYDDFYNNDIFCMDIAEFNIMPDKLFTSPEFETIVVWVDSSKNVSLSDIKEAEYLEERLKNVNYLYFCNDSIDTIISTILSYIYGSPSENEILLKEFS